MLTIFETLNSNSDMKTLCIDSTLVKAHQHSCGAKKSKTSQDIGDSRVGKTNKIHTIQGKTIPCISVKGQKIFHTGYELREVDKHDIEIIENLLK